MGETLNSVYTICNSPLVGTLKIFNNNQNKNQITHLRVIEFFK